MIALSPRPLLRRWSTLSFASTLYLKPILDLLLAEIPLHWQPELRLGLQEALVNAAKHGNQLDPSKVIMVRYSPGPGQCWWVISDQGTGFQVPASDPAAVSAPDPEAESGRGLYILAQIFDQVCWNAQGTELVLCKYLR
uniref:Putative anti-sigma regulatory factor, serine/threonine protein kinase n=1 Tax=Cyanothece sp. (strain PCC 7425 / ATCC 29141) TaxID=395961 RepID=B8HPV4_CYAP4